jgi:hypothetical protein
LYSYVRLEDRIAADHPLRAIRALVEEVLDAMTGKFEALYSHMGRPSIPPEQLLKATLFSASPSILSVFARRRIDDMAFEPFILQHTANPEAVQPRFLNDDNRERFPSPHKRLLSELREARQQHTGPGQAHSASTFSRRRPATAM